MRLFRKPAQNNVELHLKLDVGYSYLISLTSEHKRAPLHDAWKTMYKETNSRNTTIHFAGV